MGRVVSSPMLLFLLLLDWHTTTFALDTSVIWGLRTASAVTSYIGLIAYLDRPRGGDILPSDVLQMGPSTVPGAGLGLFTKHDLPAGTVLGHYPGVVVPLPQHSANKLRQYPQCEGYIWRFSDNQFVIDPTDRQGNIQTVCRGGNPSTPGSIALFENTPSWWGGVSTALCRINEPPKGKDVNVITMEDLNQRCVTFQLERNVYRNEELFIDYGLSYDRSMYNRGGGDA